MLILIVASKIILYPGNSLANESVNHVETHEYSIDLDYAEAAKDLDISFEENSDSDISIAGNQDISNSSISMQLSQTDSNSEIYKAQTLIVKDRTLKQPDLCKEMELIMIFIMRET